MASVRLMPLLDLRAATPLLAELCQARGEALELDASGVERVGALCLQVLVAARRQWEQDGKAWSIVNPSAQYLEWVGLMGANELLPDGATQ